VLLIWPVQESAGTPPASVDQLLIKGGRQRRCDGIIGITCRGQLLDIAVGMGASLDRWSGGLVAKIGKQMGSSRIYKGVGGEHATVRRRKIHVL
jgi:hypothetical protein